MSLFHNYLQVLSLLFLFDQIYSSESHFPVNGTTTKEQSYCTLKFSYSTNKKNCTNKTENTMKEHCDLDLLEKRRLKMLEEKTEIEKETNAQILNKLRDQNQQMKVIQQSFEELRSSVTEEDLGITDLEMIKEKINPIRKSKTHKRFPYSYEH